MKRIYHPYWKWEDFENGLYDLEKEYSEKEECELANKAKSLLSNNTEFYNIALKVISEWTFAAEQNLTNKNRNRQAWIGQASCCYKYKIPERITKYGWRLLSLDEQKNANKIADKIIIQWEQQHAKKISKQKCLGIY
jgi:hypothetical protein